MGRNDQPTNTVVADRWVATPTKEGVSITIAGPYENTVINITNEQLMKFQSQSMMLRNRLLKQERDAGNDKRYYGNSM